MRSTRPLAASLLACLVVCLVRPAVAEDASKPLGEPVLEAPTLRCLGVYWIISGDDNRNAKVQVEYRKAGAADWAKGMNLFRVEKGGNKLEKGESKVKVPADAWLFAGSVVLLDVDTEYELKLKLSDPDGGAAERTLKSRTIAEPAAPKEMRERHVVPGAGAGSGSKDDPFKGLPAAQAQAKPGDLFLLHAGVYEGTFEVTRSGEAGKPIIWRGAGDGEAAIDGKGKAEKRPGRAISAVDVHDVWFENLTIRNADYGIVGHRSHHLVLRRCRIHACDFGLTGTNNDKDTTGYFFISDNVMEGPCTWPRSKGIENPRGIQVSGVGHVVCYNRIRGFADAIDTFPSQRCEAIDFHNNDLSECTDDGIEMDYSERNTRCFFNRLTNVFQGISTQPVYGGPVYIFRNVMYNVGYEPFKLHNSPSGALFIHNTCVKKSMPLVLSTNEKVRNCVFRNNLFIGGAANYCYENTAPMVNCDFDYDGFGGGPWDKFMKWNGVRYDTLEDVKAKAPVYKHAVLVDQATCFAGGIRQPADEATQFDVKANDLRLKPGTAAVDAGEVLPGLNDGYKGKAPDLGAYELGDELPHYGPRPEKQ